jgi:hypothetical protein
MILTIVTLAALYFALAFCVERNRGRNLDIIACDYRDQLIEALAQLDDATRNAAYWQERTDKLVQENNTLAVDLHFTQERNVWLESCFRQRKATLEGYRLLDNDLAPRHLQMADVRMLP